ncbi:MAG: sigma-70 family RNA polymerase sigma factor [Acidaminococcaceae bacterium]
MLNKYVEELKKIALLTREEELALWQANEQGDPEAHHKLVSSYQPLVFKVAMSFHLPSAQALELIQEGTVGLLEAAEKFDYHKGVAFSLYATHRIRGRMLNYLEQEYEGPLLSLDSEHVQGSGVSWAESLVSPEPSPAEWAEREFLTSKVHEALAKLPVNEQQVMTGIYLQERSAGEMATAIQVTPSHVYRLQKKGVRRIRGMLSRLMAELKK